MSAPRSAQPTPEDRSSGPWPGLHRAWRPTGITAAGCVVVFVAVLLDVLNGGWLYRLDEALAGVIRDFGLRDSSAGNTTGFLLSQTGGRGTNVAWVLLVCIAAYAGHRTLAPVLRIAFASGLMYVVVYPIKTALSRSYPMDPKGDYLHAAGSLGGAFPSGHQVNAILISSVGAWIAVDYIERRWVRRLICAYAIIGPIIAALAVLAMNYHWLTDVIAGAALSVVFLWFTRWIFATPWGQRIEAALSF